MRIGELAKMAGLTPDTVTFSECEELLEPPSGTPTTGGIGGSLLSERPNAPQAAQQESVATSRSNVWAARRMPSPKVR